MEQSLRAEFLSFFQKFSDFSDRAVKHWPLATSASEADEDVEIGYEFKAIVTQDAFDADDNRLLIDSFFAELYASGRPFNGAATRTRKEIREAMVANDLSRPIADTAGQSFQAHTFLLIGYIPNEEIVRARAGCVMQYFHQSQTVFIESIWLASVLQQHIRSIGEIELVVDGLESEDAEIDEKILQRNREQNRQTVLSWMLTYRKPERNQQSALLELLKNYNTYSITGVFLEVQNPIELATIHQDNENLLIQAAKRLAAFHAIEARYIKFAYERPDRLSGAIGDRSCFLLTLPQMQRKSGELAIDSAVVMKFIVDYGKWLLHGKYDNERYEKDLKTCNQFRPNKETPMVGLQNGADAIARNNKSLFKNRLSEHNTFLYLHSIPRLEEPRFTYRRSSVGFEILVDEDYFEPVGLDPYHNMAPAEPKRTPLGQKAAILWKEWNPPKHGIPKALYCPVAHSGETDLFAYKYQADPPYYTRYYDIKEADVQVEFPSHFEFTSEGRMENFYQLPKTADQLKQVKESIEAGDALPQFTHQIRMEACVSYTYFLKSAVRVWHLVLKPTSGDVSELEIIKLMRFFSGSQEHENEEERRKSVRRIKFSVEKDNEQPTNRKLKPANAFQRFVENKLPYFKFQPKIFYYDETEQKIQRWAWRIKTFGQIIFWIGLGAFILCVLLFSLPSWLEKTFNCSPIGTFPAKRMTPTMRAVDNGWNWSNVLLSAVYWSIGLLVLRTVWRWLFSTIAELIQTICQTLVNLAKRLFILPEEKKLTQEKPDNLIQLLYDLTGVHYEQNNNAQFHRQMNEADQIVSLRNVRSGVVEIDTGDVSPEPEDADKKNADATSFLGFYNNLTYPKPPTVRERNKIRTQVKELYKKLYEGDIQIENAPEPFTAEEYADYVFKSYCGICLGIFDYDRMSFQEIDDTLVPLADSKTEDSFMVIHRGVLAMLGHDDDVMDTFWNTLGTNAYLLIPSAVLAHNDMVSRDADTRLDQLLKNLREGRSRLSVRQLNLERNHIDDLLNDDVLGNVFQYKTEQEIYEQGMIRRGIAERIKDARSKLEQLEKLINEKHEAGSTRYQRRITFLASLVGIFSFYEYVRDYFQNELALDNPGKRNIKEVAFNDIPLWFKIPAKLIDQLNEHIHILSPILPGTDKSRYDSLYLAHTVIAFLFVVFVAYLLALNLADPGRNKKYFWQRATSRYRSLPITNASISKTRSKSV
ncbi:hypothetical protein [Fibrella forsythiae]|uniref:Uncharacterized protein n=1 Tax=Fibrella forsythiae TaxID=2817061 RepID=A0ABS3JGS6_9BACT|nr:hypothetical protein [Fibrella forsythiae]MBO0949204.1 hypothetical protein [Fibrella forsythiae]